ncbi:sugar kinase [Yoonia sp. F2084L]|uniref:sugar kinase n=1 Tax=Yoonia sp. F2084L TaxID=2926419 RepID=UPI001FF594BB|nr:sugar kinase [Yoonia sp. F2084L]MCK0094846.1 sugar kinase [Yoonia sp. F2084L]
MISFKSNKVVAIGEAMIEMAVVGDNQYRRNFAGDTYNTAWHMAQLLGGNAVVGFVTCVGTDTLSDAFVAELKQDGLDLTAVRRISDRTMGLYLIALDGVERSFHYWRSASAATCLADDPDWLANAVEGAGLIHVSGITLAILAPESRVRLLRVLKQARAEGVRVSFDPNVRPKLWTSTQEIRTTVSDFLAVTDIALPSFDDEQLIWGDETPEKTIKRLDGAGVAEIIVKNGEAPTMGQSFAVPAPAITGIRDTSGAGDAFNAGYLVARLQGKGSRDAVDLGHEVSGEVIRHFGARIPKQNIPKLVL